MSKTFLSSSILDSVPDDTQVVLLGEEHTNILHRLYLYLNLPTLAKAGFDIALELPSHFKQPIYSISRKIGFRPYYFGEDNTPCPEHNFSKFEAKKILFPKFKNGVVTEDVEKKNRYFSSSLESSESLSLEASENFNFFARISSSSCEMKTITAASVAKNEYYSG